MKISQIFIVNSRLFTPVPKVTKEGNRLIFLRFFDIHGVKLPTSEVALKGMVMVLDMMLKICNSRSYIIVFDFENMSAPIIALGFTILKKFLTLATVSLYFRLEAYSIALIII